MLRAGEPSSFISTILREEVCVMIGVGLKPGIFGSEDVALKMSCKM